MAAAAQTVMNAVAGRSKNRAELPSERNRRVFDAQLGARRGPTPEVLFHKYIDNSRIVKADDPVRRREMRSFAVAAIVLFALVMVYVGQHLKAIEIGYANEATKQKVEQLREDNRQLRLQEAQLTDPERIHTIATTQLGLAAPLPGQVVRPDGADANTPVVAQISAPAAQ